MKTQILLAFLLFAAACSTLKKTENANESFSIPQAYRDYHVQKHEDLLVLTHVNDISLKYPEAYLDLVVFDTSTNQEILKDHLRNGKLEWIDESKFKVSYTPGNPEKEKTYNFYYNLNTKKKYDQNQLHDF